MKETNLTAPLYKWLEEPRRGDSAPGQLTKYPITVTVHHEVTAYNGVTSVSSVNMVNNLISGRPNHRLFTG
jgi:hypothetical protein